MCPRSASAARQEAHSLWEEVVVTKSEDSVECSYCKLWARGHLTPRHHVTAEEKRAMYQRFLLSAAQSSQMVPR